MSQVTAPTMTLLTTDTVTGLRVVRYLGLVRGVAMREMPWLVTGDGSLVGAVLASGMRQSNLAAAWERCEQTRAQAVDFLARAAAQLGANAVLGMRYDSVFVAAGVWEIVAYGTAVVIADAS